MFRSERKSGEDSILPGCLVVVQSLLDQDGRLLKGMHGTILECLETKARYWVRLSDGTAHLLNAENLSIELEIAVRVNPVHMGYEGIPAFVAPLEEHELCQIADVGEMGVGVLAGHSLPRGLVILMEEPMFLLPDGHSRADLEKSVSELDDESRRMLGDIGEIWEGNRLVMLEHRCSGFFRIAVRFNHSCLPNARHYWNTATKELVVVTTREIRKGEELTISYLGDALHQGIEGRRIELQSRFNFACGCSACASGNASSDAQRAWYSQLNHQSDQLRAENRREEALVLCEELRAIVRAEYLEHPKLMEHIASKEFQILHDVKKHTMAAAKLAEALRWLLISEGGKSPEILTYIKNFDCLPDDARDQHRALFKHCRAS